MSDGIDELGVSVWGVQIEGLLMEISVGNSGGSKTKSLDLKTLYKSEVSNKGEPVKKETSSWLEMVRERRQRRERTGMRWLLVALRIWQRGKGLSMA